MPFLIQQAVFSKVIPKPRVVTEIFATVHPLILKKSTTFRRLGVAPPTGHIRVCSALSSFHLKIQANPTSEM